MIRYLRIYRIFASTSLSRELEFKANFFAKIAQQLVWMAFFVMILLVVYRNTDSVAGWGRSDAIVLAATVFIMRAITGVTTTSVNEIPTQVRMGTLDFVITKPVDSQFWVSLRKVNFDPFASLIAGIGMLAYGVSKLDRAITPADIIGYICLLGASSWLFYAIAMLMMTTGIWFVRVENLWVLTESMTDVARFPTDIYRGFLREFLTYGFPLAFIATMPSRQLTKGFEAPSIAIGLTYAALAFVACRTFWRFALRHYGSASS